MSRPRISLPRLRSARLAAVLLVALLAGCGSWHATRVPGPAPGASAPQGLGTVRVRLVDGRTFVLHHAAADADTIRGELPKDRLVARHGRRVAFARGDVRSIDARHFNAVKTVGLIAVTIPLAGLAFVEMFHGD